MKCYKIKKVMRYVFIYSYRSDSLSKMIVIFFFFFFFFF